MVKAGPGWLYEGTGFYAWRIAPAGACPEGLIAVNRAYNNGFVRNDSNHRFTTSNSNAQDMVRLGWTVEGPVKVAARNTETGLFLAVGGLPLPPAAAAAYFAMTASGFAVQSFLDPKLAGAETVLIVA